MDQQSAQALEEPLAADGFVPYTRLTGTARACQGMRATLALTLTVLLPSAACLESSEPQSNQRDAADMVVISDAQVGVDAQEERDAGPALLDAASTTTEDASGAPDATEPSGMVEDYGDCHPGTGVLSGGKRSFGFCAGVCEHELALTYPIVRDVGDCSMPLVELTSRARSTGTSKLVHATLTKAAWQRAVDIGFALRDVKLKPSYGCPDCADGGASTISLAQSGAGAFDAVYEFHNPPAVLVAADAFVQSLIDQLIACTGPDIVDCQ